MAYKTVYKATEELLYQQSESQAPFAITVSAVREKNQVTYDAVFYADWVQNNTCAVQLPRSTFQIVKIPNRPPVIFSGLDWMARRICLAYGYAFAAEDETYIIDRMASIYHKLMDSDAKKNPTD